MQTIDVVVVLGMQTIDVVVVLCMQTIDVVTVLGIQTTRCLPSYRSSIMCPYTVL